MSWMYILSKSDALPHLVQRKRSTSGIFVDSPTRESVPSACWLSTQVNPITALRSRAEQVQACAYNPSPRMTRPQGGLTRYPAPATPQGS